MKKYFYKLYLLIYLFGKINWFKFLFIYKSDSKNIVWVLPETFFELLTYINSLGTIIHDLSIINSFIQNKKNFCIKWGNQLSNLQNKNIHYTISKHTIKKYVNKHINSFPTEDYTSSFLFFIENMEKNNNLLFPSSREFKWWENKGFMHKMFNDLDISCPKTWIIQKGDVIPIFDFPILLKEVHSAGSAGVYQVINQDELYFHMERIFSSGENTFLIQKLVNMRRDLRVTIIGERIVLHYWRINNDKDWKPTSTGRGSSVDFDFFPEEWRSYILNTFKKLKIRTGAFDITWENDDLTTMPIILEVSPAYQPNPKLPIRYNHLSYSKYKNTIFTKDAYFVNYIDLIFELKNELYNIYFS